MTPDEQELERLRREELAAGSRIARVHRVLLPVRRRPSGDPVHALEAQLLERLGRHNPLSITLLNVSEPGEEAAGGEFLDRLAPRFPTRHLTRKVVASPDPARAILDEAQKDYGLLVLGATERESRLDSVFHPMVDRLVRLAPCPTLVVKSGDSGDEAWTPGRILVPTNGSLAARQAAELAFRLADDDEVVVVLNVVRSRDDPHRAVRGGEDHRFVTAQAIVRDLAALGEANGVRVLPMVRTGREPDEVILEVAADVGCGLCVMGTDIRPGSDRLFLGPRVEQILERASCPVLVLNAT